MAYADYGFYTTSYYGDVVPESSFEKYIEKSMDQLSCITLNSIPDVGLLDGKSLEKVKKANCALAEVLYRLDTAMNSANSQSDSNVKSKSSGGESITYGNSETIITKAVSDEKVKNKLMYDSIKIYLWDTGYLYRGI